MSVAYPLNDHPAIIHVPSLIHFVHLQPMFRSSGEFISALEQAGELIRIPEYTDPHLEIAEVVDRIAKSTQNKALLFENTGTGMPLLINAMGSENRMRIALGVNDLDDVGRDIEGLFHSLTGPKNTLVDKLKMLPELGKISSWMPKTRSGRGECQEVVMEDPDLNKFPVMKCWPHDGGPFMTLPVIHTLSPSNGIRNVGLYRMQVFGPKLAALHWHKHKVSAGHFNEYKKLGKKMPVAVALGGDPLYVFSAACPLPPNFDEYMFTGFLRKKKVELVKCLTLNKEKYDTDMYVPADADIIIEGYVDPQEDLILEGPFGDHTGYYSLADYYPKFHITCITHKKNPVYPSTIVGIPPQEDAWMGKAIERIFLAPIKMTLLPEIIDMHMPVEGVFHNLVIVKIHNEYEGHAQKVMNAMWGAGQMMFNKILVVVDGDIDIHDYKAVARRISAEVDTEQDIYFSQGPMDVLDHACSKFAFGGKMCLDATIKSKVGSLPAGQAGSKSKVEQPANIGVKLKGLDPAIVGVNDTLLRLGISVVFLSVRKERSGQVKDLHDRIVKEKVAEGVKFMIYLEEKCNIENISDCVWRWANNFDPKRDSFLPTSVAPHPSSIGLDGTRKTRNEDGFDRPWPNIIAADEKTIRSVDEKWQRMFPKGPALISSPSRTYGQQLYPGGAVAEE